MIKKLKKYLKVWYLMTIASFSSFLFSRFAAIILLTGKFLRFLFFLFFLYLLVGKTKALGSYSLNQVVFFFLTFNLIDILVQLFLRGVYRFRSLVISGDFDLVLVRPINELFRSLACWTDLLDLITIVPLVVYMIIFLAKGNIDVSIVGILFYLLLVVNAFILALALHIMVAGVGIITYEVDNTIWIYRDVSAMGRIPVDVYMEPVRSLLTFVFPVAVLITFPAKALMGLLSWQWILFSFLLAGFFLWASLKFWKYALTRYSSASS